MSAAPPPGLHGPRRRGAGCSWKIQRGSTAEAGLKNREHVWGRQWELLAVRGKEASLAGRWAGKGSDMSGVSGHRLTHGTDSGRQRGAGRVFRQRRHRPWGPVPGPARPMEPMLKSHLPRLARARGKEGTRERVGGGGRRQGRGYRRREGKDSRGRAEGGGPAWTSIHRGGKGGLRSEPSHKEKALREGSGPRRAGDTPRADTQVR